MFDIAPSELLLLAVVALVVIGPKELPQVMRKVGVFVGKARAMANQFKAGVDEMIRESELAEMEKHWKAENERIMREHQATMTAIEGKTGAPELPSPAAELSAPGATLVAEESTAGAHEPAAAEQSLSEPEAVAPAPDRRP
jgi:sec-independent protein translocase protein TatB